GLPREVRGGLWQWSKRSSEIRCRSETQAMVFKEIAFGSDDYRLECALREEVLRKPLGLSLRSDELSREKDQLHFGLFEPPTGLIACAIAVKLSPIEAKIRQMP